MMTVYLKTNTNLFSFRDILHSLSANIDGIDKPQSSAAIWSGWRKDVIQA